jgi:hypothetical protein
MQNYATSCKMLKAVSMQACYLENLENSEYLDYHARFCIFGANDA